MRSSDLGLRAESYKSKEKNEIQRKMTEDTTRQVTEGRIRTTHGHGHGQERRPPTQSCKSQPPCRSGPRGSAVLSLCRNGGPVSRGRSIAGSPAAGLCPGNRPVPCRPGGEPGRVPVRRPHDAHDAPGGVVGRHPGSPVGAEGQGGARGGRHQLGERGRQVLLGLLAGGGCLRRVPPNL